MHKVHLLDKCWRSEMICINRDKLCTNEKITNLSYLESAVRKKI